MGRRLQFDEVSDTNFKHQCYWLNNSDAKNLKHWLHLDGDDLPSILHYIVTWKSLNS
jgi:hypothetical protein